MAQVAQSSGYSNNLNNRIDWEIRNVLDSVESLTEECKVYSYLISEVFADLV